MNFKVLLLLLFSGLSMQVFAQNDCDCPDVYEPVCVQDSSGFYFEMQNTCLAECFGFTVVNDTLCEYYNPWEDCECPDVYEPVCVQDSTGYYFEMPNACWAECFGFTVVNDTLCDYYNPWEDCECPDVYEPVCVQDSSGYYFEMPNACWAECLGFSIVNDTLCDYYNPWEDCDCEIDPNENYICASDSSGNFFYVPNECFASCFGYTVVADSLCDFYNPWEDCECPDVYEPVCVQDSLGYYFEMPNACWAECFGYAIVNDTLCDYYNPWEDCECPDVYEPVCVQDSLGYYFEMPNACWAECFGYAIVNDTLCDYYNPWEDCECPDVYEPVCVQDSLGYYFEMPNACWAECFGYGIVNDTLCDYYNPWEDCECPDVYEPVCVQDSLGYYFEMPNACWAECFGYTIVNDTLCDYYNPWGDCDCEINDEEPFICASDSMGNFFYVPNECFADCLGFTVLDGDECDILVIDNEYDESMMSCMDSLTFDDVTTFQQALLLMHNECGLEIPECVISAPIFETDEEFIQYILDNCGIFFGFEGGNVLNLFNEVSSRITTGVNDSPKASASNFRLMSNPVQDELRYRVTIDKAESMTISLIHISGQVVSKEVKQMVSGEQIFKMDISDLQPGSYILHFGSAGVNESLKVFKL